MWVPTGPGVWDDWSPVRIDATPVQTVGDLLIFRRNGVRYGVPRDLVCDCSDAFGIGGAGWIALPAWYVRSFAVDDTIWG